MIVVMGYHNVLFKDRYEVPPVILGPVRGATCDIRTGTRCHL